MYLKKKLDVSFYYRYILKYSHNLFSNRKSDSTIIFYIYELCSWKNKFKKKTNIWIERLNFGTCSIFVFFDFSIFITISII